MTFWYDVKLLIEHATGVSMDGLHILAGVLLQLLFAWLLQTTVANWKPWLAVLALVLINEASDLWVEQWPSAAIQYGESVKDIITTMFLPTVGLIVCRAQPAIFTGEQRNP